SRTLLYVSSCAATTLCCSVGPPAPRHLPSFPTRRSSDLPPPGRRHLGAGAGRRQPMARTGSARCGGHRSAHRRLLAPETGQVQRSEEHTSELQSRFDLVCRLLLEKKKEAETAE